MSGITIQSVAHTFLSFESMSLKKLQKLCYYSYSWYLTLYDKKLFENDFEAWAQGPTSPELNEMYKSYTWRNIPEETAVPMEISEEINKFLMIIYQSYGDLTGDSIEDLSHFDDPVIIARAGIPDYISSSIKINDNNIKKYFSKVYEHHFGRRIHDAG